MARVRYMLHNFDFGEEKKLCKKLVLLTLGRGQKSWKFADVLIEWSLSAAHIANWEISRLHAEMNWF